MKNKLNLFLLISFLIAVILTFLISGQISKRVGDIVFDNEFDTANFKVCNENRITQYYSTKSGYQNGQKGIKGEIWEAVQGITFKNSGYITFRFIINCNGEIGRFRVKGVDTNLKETEFDETRIAKLQNSIANCENWNAGTWKDQSLDSYFILNFKIENGQITDIF